MQLMVCIELVLFPCPQIRFFWLWNEKKGADNFVSLMSGIINNGYYELDLFCADDS